MYFIIYTDIKNNFL